MKAIERHIAKTAREVVKVGDSQICQSVILPGRFKRVYVVEEDNGIVFFSGKNIGELDPSDKKYLSLSQHAEKIKNELVIKEGMILALKCHRLFRPKFRKVKRRFFVEIP